MARALASASPLVSTICASAPPSSRVVSASASADAMRARFSPSARAITACASAAAGLTVDESSSFSLRSASSWASSVCLRTTSCCASACARGPAWSARACAAATCVLVSASRSDTSRPALIFTCWASASRTAADLERGHALDLHFDALAGDGVPELHVDLARGQLELADAIEQRAHERAASDHHLDALVARDRHRLAALIAHLRTAGAGDDQGLVGARNLVAAGDERDQQDEDDHPGHREERNGRHETRHRTLLLLWSS